MVQDFSHQQYAKFQIRVLACSVDDSIFHGFHKIHGLFQHGLVLFEVTYLVVLFDLAGTSQIVGEICCDVLCAMFGMQKTHLLKMFFL